MMFELEEKPPFTWASREELFQFCNDVRHAGGGTMIHQLMPGITNEPKSCLIAENLNFDCYVVPLREPVTGQLVEVGNGEVDMYGYPLSRWAMYGVDNITALNIARDLGLRLVVGKGMMYSGGPAIAIELPVEIGNAALAFDQNLDFNDLAVKESPQ